MRREPSRRANDLDGAEWLRCSISVWSDIRKDAGERALKPGAYCCVVVMDLRKGDRLYPLHVDLGARLGDLGFICDDLIIWDRRGEYNNLRPLGYPSVFRVNRVHEYVLIFQKPATP